MSPQKVKRASIVTPEFRVAFPAVFTAKRMDETDPASKAKFSIVMLFRVKADPKKPDEKVADLTPLKVAARQAIVDQWGPDATKWPTKTIDVNGVATVVSAIRSPFRKGTEKQYDGYDGNVEFVTASSLIRPGLIRQDRQQIMDINEFYGGCYAIATVRPYAYSVKGNMGVTFQLDNLMKMRDGDPFSGKASAENDFDAIPLPSGGELVGAAVGAADPLAGIGA